MFRYVTGLIGAMRGKLTSEYKNQLQNVGRETRTALTGVLTGDQGMFLHHPIAFDDPAEVKRFKDAIRAFWWNRPKNFMDWPAWAYQVDNAAFKGKGLSLERTAFGIVAVLIKMESLASAIQEYPDERDMVRYVAGVIQDNMDSLQKLLGDDAYVYMTELRASQALIRSVARY